MSKVGELKKKFSSTERNSQVPKEKSSSSLKKAGSKGTISRPNAREKSNVTKKSSHKKALTPKISINEEFVLAIKKVVDELKYPDKEKSKMRIPMQSNSGVIITLVKNPSSKQLKFRESTKDNEEAPGVAPNLSKTLSRETVRKQVIQRELSNVSTHSSSKLGPKSILKEESRSKNLKLPTKKSSDSLSRNESSSSKISVDGTPVRKINSRTLRSKKPKMISNFEKQLDESVSKLEPSEDAIELKDDKSLERVSSKPKIPKKAKIKTEFELELDQKIAEIKEAKDTSREQELKLEIDEELQWLSYPAKILLYTSIITVGFGYLFIKFMLNAYTKL